MANTVIALKKSATPTAAPADLANGELAINYADGKLYYKNVTGHIVSISSGSNSFGTVNANNTLVVADTSGDVLSIEPGTNISIVGDAINDKVTISLQNDVVIPSTGTFKVAAVGGDEGGEIKLGNAVTNSVLTGDIVIDVYQNRLRFYESTGTNRGAFINLASAATGVGTDLLATAGSSTDTTARDWAAAAFGQANTGRTHANAAFLNSNSAYDQANTARIHANVAFLNSNSAYDQANTARTHANAAFLSSNSVNTYSDATYVKLTSASQTITGDVSIVGNLTLSGNTLLQNVTTLTIGDPLIYLAANNYVSDTVDIGFIGNYVNATGSNVHTGLYREHEDKMYYLFQGYDVEPINNHIGALSNNMTLAVLNADLRTSNLLLAGTNTIIWIRSAYDQANTSRTHANAAFLNSNSAYDQANTGRTHANAAFLNSNSAFDQANTARTHANAAFDKANTAGGTLTVASDIVDTSRYLMFANGTSGTLPTANVTVGLTFNPSSNTLNINGALNAVTKSFVIQHPVNDGMMLRYGSLEGPENGVYVRGRLEGKSIIELPDYWWNLIDESTITVNLTPIGRSQDIWVQSTSAYFIHLNQPADCFFTVFAERKDVDKLVVEY